MLILPYLDLPLRVLGDALLGAKLLLLVSISHVCFGAEPKASNPRRTVLVFVLKVTLDFVHTVIDINIPVPRRHGSEKWKTLDVQTVQQLCAAQLKTASVQGILLVFQFFCCSDFMLGENLPQSKTWKSVFLLQRSLFQSFLFV